MEHSVLQPSSAPEWVYCPGSVSLQAKYPDDDTQDALEGAASHEAGHKGITGTFPKIGETASNGVVLTKEMIDGAKIYVEDILYTLGERGYGLNHDFIFAEYKVYARQIHNQLWGTSDCGVFFPEDLDLFIWDYKYGHGKVEAFENWQCIIYAKGFLEMLAAMGYDVRGITVWVNVVQPRCYVTDGPIRRWPIKAENLEPYFNTLRTAANNAMSKNPICVSGKHCRYCTARTDCATFGNSTDFCCDYAGQATIDEASYANLGKELTMLNRAKDMIEYRITGIQSRVESLVRSGNNVPGWKVQPKKGRLAWKRDLDDIFLIGDLMNFDLRKPEAITPQQAIDRGVDPDLVNAYAERPNRGVSIVPDDGSDARKHFSKE